MTPKKKLLALGLLIVVLAAAFWYGGSAPGLQGWTISSQPGSASSVPSQKEDAPLSSSSGATSSVPESPTSSASKPSESSPPPAAEPTTPPSNSTSSQDGSAASSSSSNGGSSADTSAPTQPETSLPADSSQVQESSQTPQALACTISIGCESVLDHMDWLDPDKVELIPADGVILAETQVSFEEGETVFDVLQRLTRQEGIHLEASFTPGYNSSYVEGIANLYEFDCGQQSGWLYLVNGISPGYSSSQYVLSNGDEVEWVYTCQLGEDVGVTP